MIYKLKRPVKSPVGVQRQIEAVELRDLTADDIVEAYSSAGQLPRQMKALIVRCTGLLPEEVGKFAAIDYLALVELVQDQLMDPGPDESADPKD